MHVRLGDHRAFQHAVFGLVGVGAASTVIATALALPEGARFAGPVVVTALIIEIVRRRWFAPPAGTPLPLAVVVATSLVALAAVGFAFPELFPQLQSVASSGDPSALGVRTVLTGALSGLVAGLGVLPVLLVRGTDGAAANARRFASRTLAPEDAALSARALEAYQRLHAGLADLDDEEARGLDRTAGALVREVVALTARSSDLRRELAAIDPASLTARADALVAASQATSDSSARADFLRAERAVRALEEDFVAQRTAADRVRARLAVEVVALESAALALATRRATRIASEALTLSPLEERLREAGAALGAEAAALSELGAA